MGNGINGEPSTGHDRRGFLTRVGGLAAAGGAVSSAGCIGGLLGSDAEGVLVPGLYDLGGATSDVGRPTGLGSRDAIAWINENEDVGDTLGTADGIAHEWIDYAYEVPEAQSHYDEYAPEDPPAFIGWGTADTEALASNVAEDEIVYVSASYSDNLLAPETDYNFFTNMDYTSQARAHLKWINENDPGSTAALIHNTTPFGTTIVEGANAYGQSLDGVEMADNIALELAASDASTQVTTAENNGVDYLIHQNTGAPMQVLLDSIDSADSDITVMGLTWTTDEGKVLDSPELFNGVRYVNSNKSFGEVESEEPAGWQIIEESIEREGRDIEDPTVANINYVRGVVHALLLYEAMSAADDPSSGSAVQDAIFGLDDFDARGLLISPVNFQEGDRRPTMTGRTYEVQDGEMVPDQDIELPRDEGWIPPFEF